MVRSLSFALILGIVSCSVICCDDSGDSPGGSSGFAGDDASFDGALGDGSSPSGDAAFDANVPPGMLFPISQDAYLKASNTRYETSFGAAVALSADGSTLVVGGPGDSSSATGIGGSQADGAVIAGGAVYVFRRAGATWSQEAYIKSSNTARARSSGKASRSPPMAARSRWGRTESRAAPPASTEARPTPASRARARSTFFPQRNDVGADALSQGRQSGPGGILRSSRLARRGRRDARGGSAR